MYPAGHQLADWVWGLQEEGKARPLGGRGAWPRGRGPRVEEAGGERSSGFGGSKSSSGGFGPGPVLQPLIPQFPALWRAPLQVRPGHTDMSFSGPGPSDSVCAGAMGTQGSAGCGHGGLGAEAEG